MKKLLTIAALSTLLATPALAQQEWRISLATGSSTASDPTSGENGESADIDSDTPLHIVLNKFQRINNDGARLYYEFLYAQNDMNVDIKAADAADNYSTSLSAQHLHLGGTYEWGESKVFDPYFAATMGASHYSPEQASSDTFFSMSAALGARFWVIDNLSLRFEARAFGTLMNSSSEILCLGGTCYVEIDGSLWLQNHFTAGLTYAF